MRIIDKIKQFDDFEMAQFICEISKEQLTRCVKCINDKYGAELITIVIQNDLKGMQKFLNEEIGE